MNIELKLSYDNVPYLVLIADDESVEDSALENFIRNAKEVGLEIHNESSIDSDDGYASITLKGKKQ